jgi:hypothetical protein
MEALKIAELFKIMAEKNLSIDEVIKMVMNYDVSDKSIRPNTFSFPSLFSESFELPISYRSLEEMIEAGRFDGISSGINSKNFTVPTEFLGKTVVAKCKIFHFTENMKAEKINSFLEFEGFHHASLFELLALAKMRPELQRERSVAALGSFWIGPNCDRLYPCLNVYLSERRLGHISLLKDNWLAGYRFLAVQNAL